MKFKNEDEFVGYALKNHMPAIDFVKIIARISQAFDDWVDGDNDQSYHAKLKCIINVLCELPRNPFYIANFSELQPVIELGLFDWCAANKLEHSDENGKRVAFVIRDNVYSIVLTCARIISGPEWAAEISADIRSFIHNESFDDYSRGLSP